MEPLEHLQGVWLAHAKKLLWTRPEKTVAQIAWPEYDGFGRICFFVAKVDKLFDNCYTFEADGDWIDKFALPATGTWEQGRVGASTSYTASLGPIEQRGTVSPA